METTAVVYVPESTRPALWQNRTFVALWTGQAISVVGDGFHSIALGLWVLQTTGSATAMASIMTVRMLVTILLGSLAGAVVDRADRRRLMVGMDLARFALVGGVALLVAHAGTPLLPIILLTGLISICGNFFGPAFQASLVNIVDKDDVQKATSLLQVTNTLASVVGPFLGGAVVATFGGWAALTGDAVSFALAALLIWLGGAFPSPRREAQGKSSLWADMQEGFAYLKGNALALNVVTIAPLLNFFAAAAFMLLPVIAVKTWHASATQLGTLEAIFPLGFALGGILVMTLAKRMARRGWWMLGGILLSGVGMAFVARMPSAVAAMPVLLATGFANAIVNVLLNTIMQSEVPPEVQGRVFGTLGSVCGLANPASLMVAGLLADVWNPVAIATAASLGMVLVSVLCIAGSRALRAYN
jgi:MFS transporter, DHA3 family, macrolide efflux protein